MSKYTFDQYVKLKAAYASGTLTVKYVDQSITYQSSEQIRRILDEMEVELGLVDPRSQGVLNRMVRGVHSKGV